LRRLRKGPEEESPNKRGDSAGKKKKEKNAPTLKQKISLRICLKGAIFRRGRANG